MGTMLPTPKDKRATGLNKRIKLPRNRYTIRIVEEKFEISKAGNPMLVLTPEIVAPDTFTNPVDGSTVNISGTKLKPVYVTLAVAGDDKKSQAMFDRYSDLRDKAGKPIDKDVGVDVNNPPKALEGVLFDAMCDGKEYTQNQDPTPAQAAKGERGAPILDADGKPMKGYSCEVVEILGPADPSIAGSRPY